MSTKEIPIRSIKEFHEKLGDLVDKAGFIYRGQSDTRTPVDCSAARRLKRHPANGIEEQLINHLLIGYLEYLIAKARMRGFIPSGLSETSTDLELLAQLQHQEAATGLIDFTQQPLVALWFACNKSNNVDGAVYTLSNAKTEEIHNREKLEKEIRFFYEGDELWRWEPSVLGSRIVAQSSVLVFGRPIILPTEMKKIIIDAESKASILAQLETIYGINEESLFSDFSGYAVANGQDKNFDLHRAIRYWLEQIELASDNDEKAEAHFNCGVAYGAIMKHEESIEQYDKAIANNSAYPSTYSNRGVAKDRLGDYQGAIADYDEAITLAPQYSYPYCNRGNAKDNLGDHQEAIADYDKAIEISPQYAEAYYSRGNAKTNLGDHQEAIADYDKAIEIDPRHIKAYNNRGNAKSKFGKYSEAIDDYDRAIEIDPQISEHYNNRGNAKNRLGKYPEAIDDYDKAIEIDPQISEHYNNRGAAKSSLCDYQGGLADFDKAVNLNPQYAEVYFGRGLAKKELDDSAAEKDLEKAFALAKEQGLEKLAQLMQRKLDELNKK